jgi:hypothetical protein
MEAREIGDFFQDTFEDEEDSFKTEGILKRLKILFKTED